MGTQNQLELSNQEKMTINAQMSYLHQSLAFFEHLRTNNSEIKSTEQAIEFYMKTHAQNLMDYMDLIKGGTEPTRAQSILLEALKRTMVGNIENERRRIQTEN